MCPGQCLVAAELGFERMNTTSMIAKRYVVSRHWISHGGVTSRAVDYQSKQFATEAAAFAFAHAANVNGVIACVYDTQAGARNTSLTQDGWRQK